MRTSTAEGNKLHYAALKQCEEWVNAKDDNEIDYGNDLISNLKKSPLNKHSSTKHKKVVLTGMTPTQMVKTVLAEHKELTRIQIVDLTGLSGCSISRATRKLEDDGFLTRGQEGQGIGREVVFRTVEE